MILGVFFCQRLQERETGVRKGRGERKLYLNLYADWRLECLTKGCKM